MKAKAFAKKAQKKAAEDISAPSDTANPDPITEKTKSKELKTSKPRKAVSAVTGEKDADDTPANLSKKRKNPALEENQPTPKATFARKTSQQSVHQKSQLSAARETGRKPSKKPRVEVVAARSPSEVRASKTNRPKPAKRRKSMSEA
jgi:hypothetical protein